MHIGRVADFCERNTNLWLLVLLGFAVAHAWLIFATTLPPLHDYAGHLARNHIMASLGESEILKQYYAYDWRFRHNIGSDIIIVFLSYLLPIEVAGRIVAAAIPPLTMWGMATVRYKVHGRVDSLVLLGVPYAMGVWFGWGFLNFCLSVALALLAFALWLDARAWRPLWRSLALTGAGLIVWLCHLSGWAFLCILVVSWEIAAAWEQRGRSLARLVSEIWWAGVRTLPLLAPIVVMALTTSGGTQEIRFDSLASKLNAPFWSLAFTWDRADKYCVVLLALMALTAVVLRLVTVSKGLGLAAIILLVCYFVSPTHFLGAISVDTRLLTPFALTAAGALTWRAGLNNGWRSALVVAITAGLVMVPAARLAYTAVAVQRFDEEISRNLAMIEHIPKGARILGIVVDGFKGGRPPLTFIPAMSVVRRDAYYNMLWEKEGGHTLRLLHQPKVILPKIVDLDESGRSNGSLEAALASFPLDSFDFVWIVNTHLAAPVQSSRLALVGKTERTGLYRLISKRSSALWPRDRTKPL